MHNFALRAPAAAGSSSFICVCLYKFEAKLPGGHSTTAFSFYPSTIFANRAKLISKRTETYIAEQMTSYAFILCRLQIDTAPIHIHKHHLELEPQKPYATSIALII